MPLRLLRLRILFVGILADKGIENSFFAGTSKAFDETVATSRSLTVIIIPSVSSFPPTLLGLLKKASAVSMIYSEFESATCMFSTRKNSGLSLIEQFKKQTVIVNKIMSFFIFIFFNLLYLQPLNRPQKYYNIVSNNNIVIREIRPEDNAKIESVIREVFIEYKLPLVGTAYADSETPKMFEAYSAQNDVYFVVTINGVVEGGGGLKTLNGTDGAICEIQKMYFSSRIRGKGFGKKMFQKCLETAKTLGFKTCYLETIPELKEAIHIYESNGFKHLKAPLGNTGHYNCGVWMIKDL
jgi:putative acetyltransferase